MTEQAKADVEESHGAIEGLQVQIADLERQRQEMVAEIHDRWGKAAGSSSDVTVVPKKSDVFVSLFGVAWMPYYRIRTASESIELPAFGAQ